MHVKNRTRLACLVAILSLSALLIPATTVEAACLGDCKTCSTDAYGTAICIIASSNDLGFECCSTQTVCNGGECTEYCDVGGFCLVTPGGC